MDTKIIQQYGEDILCYRLPTARQKKRKQYKDLEKHLIQLGKERKALYQQKWSLGWEPLTPPVQKGWKRFFVLRDDVARSAQADFFQGILDKINTYDWSHRKNFVIRTRRYGKKKYAVKSQKLKEHRPGEFLKHGFSDKEKMFFHEEWRLYNYKYFQNHFVFNEPWRFVLRVRPNMITKMKKIDSEIDARLKEIDNYMGRNDYRGKQSRLLHGNYKWKEWKWKNSGKYDEADPFKNKSLHQIMDLVKE